MRIVGALLVLLLAAIPAAAQTDDAPSRQGVTAKPSALTNKFRKPTARTTTLRAKAVAKRTPTTAPQQPLADAAAPAGEGTLRTAAAAAKRRPPTPPPPRDNASMPLADRIAIQFDLAWTGDYNGLINGEFNDKTIAAIKTFQRNRKFRETGVLNTQERALLAASAKAKQTQVGWTMIDDAVTGARLGLPTKQVPIKSQSKIGTRWSSAQGQVQIETFRIREPGTTLPAVFEQQKK